MRVQETLPAPPHYDIIVLDDLSTQDGGFLRRLSRVVCTVSPSGERSAPLIYDEVDRRALDAVVIVPHFLAKNEQGLTQRYVVLRSAIRPPLALRKSSRSPISENENRGLWEVPAGLVEAHERGLDGLRAAAARELAEETGFFVSPMALHELGPSSLPAPGVIAERHFYFHVEVDPLQQASPQLDGSALEAAGELIAVPVAHCLLAARLGELQDTKTELALRRLADELPLNGER